MAMIPDSGYNGEPGRVFMQQDIMPGDTISLDIKGRPITAVLLPNRGLDCIVYVRMDDGYLIGIDWEQVSCVQKIEGPIPRKTEKKVVYPAIEQPQVVLLSTGGTIAGRPDPDTGGLIAGHSAAELYSLVPELADIARVRVLDLFSVLSENMMPAHWVRIAQAVARAIEEGIRGVVISHGTDTLHYTAAALSFMIQRPSIPIVLVGSQKSIERPSSDAALNLIHAVQVASGSDIAEVVVTMFGPTSDQYGIIHRGTRVRKMHTSARSTFRTINDIPLGIVDEKGIRTLRNDYNRRGNPARMDLKIGVCEDAVLLYFYPGMRPEVVDFYIDHGYKDIVVAGTGMGHCNAMIIDALKRAVDKGANVFMTSQTLWGSANPYSYQTGRMLLEAGVTFLGNMLPETAITKLYWALSQSKDTSFVRGLMKQNIAHEFIDREPPDGYLIYQGGIPEVAEFLKKERL